MPDLSHPTSAKSIHSLQRPHGSGQQPPGIRLFLNKTGGCPLPSLFQGSVTIHWFSKTFAYLSSLEWTLTPCSSKDSGPQIEVFNKRMLLLLLQTPLVSARFFSSLYTSFYYGREFTCPACEDSLFGGVFATLFQVIWTPSRAHVEAAPGDGSHDGFWHLGSM